MNIIMLDQNGEEWDVAEENFDAAIAKGYTPALEMVSPEGEEVLVKRPDLDAALSKGFEYKIVKQAKEDAAKIPGDQIPPYAVPGYGAADTASFGLSGDVAGIQSALSGKGFEKGREAYRQTSRQAQEESPYLYALGQGLGIAGTAGFGVAKTLPGLVGAGAAFGGIQAYGEGQGSPLERAAKIPEAVTTSGLVNLGLFGGPGLVKKGIQRIAGTPEELAYRATGGMQANKKMLGNKTQQDVGRALLEENVIGWIPRSKETLATRANQRIGQLENLNDEMVIGATKQGARIKSSDIVSELGDKANMYANQVPSSNKRTAKAIQRERQALMDKYGLRDPQTGQIVQMDELSPREAIELRRSYQKPRNYSPLGAFDPRKQAEKETASTVREKIIKEMERQFGPEEAARYAQNNRRQGELISGQNILEDQIQRDANRKKIGLTDWIALSGSASAQAYVGKKLSEAYGAQVAGKIMYELGKFAKTKNYQVPRSEIAKRFGPKVAEILSQSEQE